jgi:hypothetical protein
MQLAAPPVRVGRGRDGILTYTLSLGPEDLPPVRARDLEAAWDAARALRGVSTAPRAFRFDGSAGPLEMTLDGRARRWAAGADGVAGLHTCRGVALCLRLVALSDLATRVVGAPPPPALLHAAAAAHLTADGQLDLASLPSRERWRGSVEMSR